MESRFVAVVLFLIINLFASNLLSVTFNYSTGVITYITGSSGVTAVNVGGGWWKVIMVVESGVSNNDTILGYVAFAGSAETAGEYCYIYRPYLGRGTTAPEVIPAVAGTWDPHGSGIDGAKYFSTDYTGSRALQSLNGLRKEIAATNNLRSCRDLRAGGSDTPWWKSNTIEPELVTNGDFSDDSGWVKGTGWTISGGTANFAPGTASRLTLAGVATIGKTYIVTFTIVSVSGSYVALELGSTSGPGSISSAGTYSIQLVCGTVDGHIGFYAPSGTTCVIDNVSAKEAAVQCTQATGIDGIANTATTLTAAAADAIILQPTSGIASADRCASAYVKRRTGTGTISFTQDGGSSWTDITSSINASTWSRVQITATLPNPSVGFKISTSGDAIDVDVVQNEAGTVATSPIVTTTTAVTRNLDSLTYQTAGNIDFAVGTCFSRFKSSGSLTSRYSVSLTNGYSYINSSGANTAWSTYDGTTIVAKTGLDDMTSQTVNRIVAWGDTTQKVTGNGLAPASGAFDGSWGSGTTITIGNSIGGTIKDVAIFPTKFSDEDMQEVTK